MRFSFFCLLFSFWSFLFHHSRFPFYFVNSLAQHRFSRVPVVYYSQMACSHNFNGVAKIRYSTMLYADDGIEENGMELNQHVLDEVHVMFLYYFSGSERVKTIEVNS